MGGLALFQFCQRRHTLRRGVPHSATMLRPPACFSLIPIPPSLPLYRRRRPSGRTRKSTCWRRRRSCRRAPRTLCPPRPLWQPRPPCMPPALCPSAQPPNLPTCLVVCFCVFMPPRLHPKPPAAERAPAAAGVRQAHGRPRPGDQVGAAALLFFALAVAVSTSLLGVSWVLCFRIQGCCCA